MGLLNEILRYVFEPRVPKEASDFLKAKQLKPSFDWQDVWRQEHANAFTVARTTQIDVLSDIHYAVRDALEKGMPFSSFQKKLTPILVSKGWWGIKEQTDPQTGEVKKVQLGSPRRLKIIYWANMASARAAGQWERAQRTKDALPYFLYTQTSSQDPRHEHLAWVGTILPIDHVWWQTHYPPNGWMCKCGVRQISKFEAQRRGGETKPINFPPKPFRRKLPNGEYETTIVPGGIDAGWDTNPAFARTENLQVNFDNALKKAENVGVDKSSLKQIKEAALIMKPSPVQGGAKQVSHVEEFEAAIAKNETGVFMGIESAPLYMRDHFQDTKKSLVMISSDTAGKKLETHPEFKNLRDLQVISAALLRFDNAVEVRTDSLGHISIFGKYKMAGRKQWDLWQLVVKRTKAGEYLITTAHRTDEKRILRFRKRSTQTHGLDILKLERK